MIIVISPAKQEALSQLMAKAQIREEDLEETFVRASGPGGQKVNKTSVAVQILHRPSGTRVVSRETRSQALNRFLARRKLAETILARKEGALSERRQQIEKIRRQKRKRSQRAKAKMLDAKSRQGTKKALRGRPRDFD